MAFKSIRRSKRQTLHEEQKMLLFALIGERKRMETKVASLASTHQSNQSELSTLTSPQALISSFTTAQNAPGDKH